MYDKGGIDEYPLFYEKYVRDITQEPVKTWVYENVNLDDNSYEYFDMRGISNKNE